MRLVTVAAVQMSLKEADTDGNTARALDLLDRAGREGAGLAVLPEMWWTGFSFRRLPAFADETPASLGVIGEVARRHGMAVIGTWPEREGDRIFNTAYVVAADGEVRASYRKVHLFRPMKEDLFLSPGDSLTTVDLHFGRVGVAVGVGVFVAVAVGVFVAVGVGVNVGKGRVAVAVGPATSPRT